MKPETFVILIPGFAANEADSTCLPSQQLFVKMLKEKYPALNVVVIAFQYPFITREYDLYNCRVISLGGKGRSKFFRLLLWRKAWASLKRLNTENNVIGLLSFWCGECALIGKRFGGKFNIKHYCWIQGQDAKNENKYVSRIKPAANELIALSDFIQREFEKNHGIRPQWLITPGIDPRQFPGEVITKDIDLLAAGSLIPLKQYDVFVEIINSLRQEMPGIGVMLCGKGPEENRLKELIANYSLQKNIIMPGELVHSQLLQQMKRARIFLHTSNYEGFGVVCIEALYAGAHVISFCKPMNEAILHWHIVATKEAMTQKAIDLLNNTSIEYNPVLRYTMQESIEKIMPLFGK